MKTCEKRHQKTAQRAVLVNLADSLKDWIDTLERNIAKGDRFVKAWLAKWAWTCRGLNPVDLGYQSNLANLPAKKVSALKGGVAGLPPWAEKARPYEILLRRRLATARQTPFLALLFFFLFAFAHPSPIQASEITNQFTLEVWVKPETTVASKAILGKAEEVRLFTDVSGYPGCQFKTTTWQTASSDTSALALNTWAHVACVYDHATLKLYVNGVQKASTALTTAVDDTSAVFKLGQDDSGSTTYTNFIGSVDRFQVYNYARSQKQIVADMEANHPAVGGGGGARQPAVAYYDFDTGYGTTAYNLGNGGTSLNGTISGTGVTWTNSGKFSKAVSCNGASSTDLTIADNDALSFSSGGMSVSTWIKRDSSTRLDTILHKDNGSNQREYEFGFHSNGKLYFFVLDNTAGGYIGRSAPDFDAGVWHHVLATYNGGTSNTDVKIYLDGVQVDTTNEGSGSFTTMRNTTAPLYICQWSPSFTWGVDGTIDDLKIYSYALSAEEVKLDYNHGSALNLGAIGTTSSNLPSNSSTDSYCPPGQGTTCVAPVAEWNMDEGTGTTVQDTSGNGYYGTISGTTNWVAGKFGKALEFDGSTSDITLSSAINLGTVHTISFWAKRNAVGGAEGITLGKDGAIYALDFASNVLYYGTNYSITQSWNYTWNANWHFYSVSRNGTSITLYIDGISQGEKTLAQNYNFDGLNHIGNAGHSWHWPGLLDQIRLYNYARTPAQVAWDYNQGGPVGWWEMNETEGTTAYDSSGNSNTGTTTGATLMATGKRGYGYSFNGSSDVVTVTDNSKLNFGSNDFSASVWVKASQLKDYNRFVTKYTSTPLGWIMYGDSSGTAFVNVAGASATVLSLSMGSYDTTNWHHFVVTKISNQIKTYRDGVLVSTNNTTVGNTDSGTNLLFGNYTTIYHSGSLDDVKIWNYALTATQVKTEYNSGAVRFGN